MTNYSHRNCLKLMLSVRNIQHTSSEFNSTLSTDSAQTILPLTCFIVFLIWTEQKKNPTIFTMCSWWCWVSSDYIWEHFFLFINKEVFLKISSREKSEVLPLLRDTSSKTLSMNSNCSSKISLHIINSIF